MTAMLRVAGLAATLYAASASGSGESRPLTVADAIATARIATARTPLWQDSDTGADIYIGQDPEFVSPDGARYLAMLIRGDVQRDGLWAEFVTASLDSFETAQRYRRISRLFTRGKGAGSGMNHTGGSESLTVAKYASNVFPFKWVDNEHVALLWENAKGIRQVVRVSALTGQTDFVTDHPNDVRGFSFGPGGTLIYVAQRPSASKSRSAALLRDGFVVSTDDVFNILWRDVDPDLVRRSYQSEAFLLHKNRLGNRSGSQERPIKIGLNLAAAGGSYNGAMQFSPDGRFVVVNAPAAVPPAEWRAYRSEFVRATVEHTIKEPVNVPAQQLFVVDADSGAVRPLWSAPVVLIGPPPLVLWSPDSRSVLVGPTFLPAAQADARGLAGKAIAEVDANSGEFWTVPLPESVPASAARDQSRWLSPELIEIGQGSGGKPYYFTRTPQGWKEAAKPPQLHDRAPSGHRFKVEVRQDVNSPPQMYAVEVSSRREQMILDPNPRLTAKFALGRVERIQGKGLDGMPWTGHLYYPAGYEPTRRYPLVIQARRGTTGAQFSLYGVAEPGLGPCCSVYAAQALAARNIAVLQLASDQPKHPELSQTLREAEIQRAAYEAAVDQLTRTGLVDPERVGLVGFSKTGWHVEYALTHSSFPYAAAIAADNMDGSYAQEIQNGQAVPTGEPYRTYGAPPVGDGLKAWFADAPGFNAHRIRTPLRLHVETALEAALFQWEMFSQMRRLKKPVELYVIPDADHGTHALQNPSQVLAAQQGAVDWFDFWLNDHEDPAPNKSEQYRRWRELRTLQNENAGEP